MSASCSHGGCSACAPASAVLQAPHSLCSCRACALLVAACLSSSAAATPPAPCCLCSSLGKQCVLWWVSYQRLASLSQACRRVGKCGESAVQTLATRPSSVGVEAPPLTMQRCLVGGNDFELGLHGSLCEVLAPTKMLSSRLLSKPATIGPPSSYRLSISQSLHLLLCVRRRRPPPSRGSGVETAHCAVGSRS